MNAQLRMRLCQLAIVVPACNCCVSVQISHQDIKIMLDPSVPLRTRSAAQRIASERMAGHMVKALHGAGFEYTFHGFSSKTPRSKFPKDSRTGCVPAP
jgi:hypothetical protein